SRRLLSLPDDVSHRNTQPTLLPEAKSLPSGVKAAPHSEPFLGEIERSFFAVPPSQSKTLPKATEASNVPFGANAASLGLLACPRSVARNLKAAPLGWADFWAASLEVTGVESRSQMNLHLGRAICRVSTASRATGVPSKFNSVSRLRPSRWTRPGP